MGNNNNRNNNGRQQGQQPQQGQQTSNTVVDDQDKKDDVANELGEGLQLESADLDAPNSLGTLAAAPNANNAAPVDGANKDNNAEVVDPAAQQTADNTTQQHGEYVPPEQVNTAPVVPVVQQESEEEPTPVVTPPGLVVPHEEADDEASLIEDPAQVLKGEMVTADGTAVTTIMLRRLEKHMKFVRGELAFRDKNELFDEQVTWIDTVGNSLNLEYPQFVLVTKAILAEMLKDVDLFRDGAAYRFLQSIKGKYPANAIEGYEAYCTFLTRVAANWNTRHRLRTSVDIAFPVSRLPTAKGKENLTKFFNTLVK